MEGAGVGGDEVGRNVGHEVGLRVGRRVMDRPVGSRVGAVAGIVVGDIVAACVGGSVGRRVMCVLGEGGLFCVGDGEIGFTTTAGVGRSPGNNVVVSFLYTIV